MQLNAELALGWAGEGVCPYVGSDALVWAAGR